MQKIQKIHEESFYSEQRIAGTKSPRLTWGSSHSTGPRAGFWPKKEGEEKAVWEGRERTSGQVEARR